LFEEQFSTKLGAALREFAAGRGGMFGRNDIAIAAEGQHLREALRSKTAEELLEAGQKIERLRRELGHTESYPVYKRFLEYRQMHGSNTPGEPKLATQFMKELGIKRQP
jgi:hypothetical protein